MDSSEVPVTGTGPSEQLPNLPPPPPEIPQGYVPEKMEEAKPILPRATMKTLVPMKKPEIGKAGRPVQLLCNFYKVFIPPTMPDAYQYSVNLLREGGGDNRSIKKEWSRMVMDKAKEVYGETELGGRNYAYDGEKCLYTFGPLPNNKIELLVVLDGRRNKLPSESEQITKRTREDLAGIKFSVEINFAAKVPMKAVFGSVHGDLSDKTQDAMRVLDIILKQIAVKRSFLLVRQSFFHWSFGPPLDLSGSVQGCRGYHSSFRRTQAGLALNMDLSTTMLLKQGPVLNVLVENQKVNHPRELNWKKANDILKGVRIKVLHTNSEAKVFEITDKPCNQLLFTMKVKKGGNGDTSTEFTEISVADYFKLQKKIDLGVSQFLPCLHVGSKKKPNYLPMELCEILPMQRYRKSLSVKQRSLLVESSRQKPYERIQVLSNAMSQSNYNQDSLFQECHININHQLVSVNGRELEPPMLSFGNNHERPRQGRWNFNSKTTIQGAKIECWAMVNFDGRKRRSEVLNIARELQACCERKGMTMDTCKVFLDEDPPAPPGTSPIERVERMIQNLRSKLPRRPDLVVCILPERKTSDLYGPWKRRFLSELGVPTQCFAPARINDQYLTNLALKINAKSGGLNSQLQVELKNELPIVSTEPTMIVGMDVSHGSQRSDSVSIAAVVSSREWPKISKYRASIRTQSHRAEMIEALYKKGLDGNVDSMIKELLIDFYQSCVKTPSVNPKPARMIIFRDGVSESQFDQVLNVELDSIIQAFNSLEEGYRPKITLIIAQKNHHTRLFPTNGTGNVQPGTIVDSTICDPRNYDFYLVPQNGPIGTSRPTHYHVLLDENEFAVDDLQKLIHYLSYVYQRSTTAISSVAPINYAHLAAAQMQQFLKGDDYSSSGRGCGSSEKNVPSLPALHNNIKHTMFFC